MIDVKRGVNVEGIGLGLCISKQIVERFKGKMGFFSKENKGTTFYFTFEIEEFDQTAAISAP
jgi:signal transduction histidine kinase